MFSNRAAAFFFERVVSRGCRQVLALSLLCAGLLGLTDAISVAIRQTAVQLHTPDEFRGRVSGVAQITYQGGNAIGAVNAGFAAAAVGVGQATLLGGLLVGLVVVLCGWLIKPLRTFRA